MFLLLASGGHFYTPWSWLPRIVMQFTAGALVCAAVRKLQAERPGPPPAGYAALLLLAVIVGALYWFDAHPIPTVRDGVGLVDVLFIPLVFASRSASGGLTGLLSHPADRVPRAHLVQPVHGSRTGAQSWIWTTRQFGLLIYPSLAGKFTFIGLLAIAVVGAMLLYHWVEEPARRWMRGMMGPTTKVRDAGNGKLAPIHGPHDEPTPLSVRAV